MESNWYLISNDLVKIIQTIIKTPHEQVYYTDLDLKQLKTIEKTLHDQYKIALVSNAQLVMLMNILGTREVLRYVKQTTIPVSTKSKAFRYIKNELKDESEYFSSRQMDRTVHYTINKIAYQVKVAFEKPCHFRYSMEHRQFSYEFVNKTISFYYTNNYLYHKGKMICDLTVEPNDIQNTIVKVLREQIKKEGASNGL